MSRTTSSASRKTARKPKKRANYNKTQTTRSLLAHMVRNVEDAWYFARMIGLPMNFLLTIACEMIASLPADERQAQWQELLRRLRKFFTDRKLQTAYVWTRESQLDGGWEHLHVLIHVPRHYIDDFRVFLSRWEEDRDIDLKPATYATWSCGNGKRGSVLRYITKNSPAAAKGDGSRMSKRGGPITGMRCGTSRNVAGPARSRAKGHPRLSRQS